MTKREKKLNKEQMRLVEWLATPKDSRTPTTLGELTKEIGVSPGTISRWRRNLNVDEQAAEIARQGLFDHLPEIYERLAKEAKGGSSQHIRLFLEVTNSHSQKIDITMEDRTPEINQKILEAKKIQELREQELRDD